MSNTDVMNRKLADMINDDTDHDTVDTNHYTESTDEKIIELKMKSRNKQNIEEESEIERNAVIIQRWWRQRQLVLHTLLIYGMDKVGIILLLLLHTEDCAG